MAGFDAGSVFVKIKTDITEFQKGMKQVEDRVSGLSSSIKGIGEGVAEFGKQAAVFTTVVGTGLGVAGVKALTMAGDLEQSTQAFKALLGSAEKAGTVMSRIKREAATTPFELKGLTDGALALTAITKDGDKAINTLLDVGKAIAISGKGQAELDRVIMNLQQVASTGKVTEMDIRQFQGAIPIFNDILDAAGLTTDELKSSDKAATLLFDAFEKAGAEGGIAFEGFAAQAGTFNQLISNIKDSVNIFLSDFVKQTGIFDAVKNALGNLVIVLDQAGPMIIGFLKSVQENEQVQEFFSKLVDVFTRIGDWVKENQELVMKFLTGLGIALGVLLIVGTITALVTALLNPLVLVALAIAALYTAWETNFMGIQDWTKKVVDFVIDIFDNILKPAFQLFSNWFMDRWEFIKIGLLGTWEIIKGAIQLAWAAIYGIITIGLALLQGDWSGAWEQFKKTLSIAWDGIRNILAGIVNFIMGWAGTVFNGLIKPFEDAWKSISETVEKIKDALDFTKRHSPSVMDIINRSVRLANDAVSNLDFGMNLGTHGIIGASAGAPVGGGMIANIKVDMAGAYISSETVAEEFGEKIGDSIMRKLQLNVRF